MVVKIWNHYIIIEVLPVHLYQVEEADVVVCVAVYDNRCSLCLRSVGRRCVDSVELVASFTNQGRVLEYSFLMKSVVPGNNARIAGFGLVAVAFEIIPVFLRQQGIAAHESSCQTAGHQHR